MYTKEQSLMENTTIPQRKRTPSFSSSLLDAIYRSIDESNDQGQVLNEYKKETVIQKQSNSVLSVSCSTSKENPGEEKQASNLRRAIMIESWMEKHSSVGSRGSIHSNSASSSSGSSSNGCLFSSSETESSSMNKSWKRYSYCTPQRGNSSSDKKKKQDRNVRAENFTNKTKLSALKIYGELKKVKQPISPGGRIANFINSIFSSGSGKKVKMCSIGATEDVSFEQQSKSTCSSSVTSYSRSCLNKTPPSRAKKSNNNNNNSSKRSVRFYPVSVIVGEDSRPCGHKCIYDQDPGLMPLPHKLVESSSLKLQEVSNRGNYYKKKNVIESDFKGFRESYVDRYSENDDNEDEDEDDMSCSSSDLFELDHLIGIGRYREELPVYETTNFKKNQAIANGFIF